ncbi:MAG: patatin-like phospholipase family protein [Alphaproteobacteria bacterium]
MRIGSLIIFLYIFLAKDSQSADNFKLEDMRTASKIIHFINSPVENLQNNKSPERFPSLHAQNFENRYHNYFKGRFLDDPSRHELILNAEGYGVRGIYSASMLRGIEKDTNEKICKIFQGGVNGASTGSVISLLLTCPYHIDLKTEKWLYGPYSAKDVVQIYEHIFEETFTGKYCIKDYRECCLWNYGFCDSTGSNIKNFFSNIFSCFGYCDQFFGSQFCESPYCTAKTLGCFGACYNCGGCCGPKHNNKKLTKQLKYYFGDMRLGETLVPSQVVSINIQKEKANINSYENPEIPLWEAALATSATPVYFPLVAIGEEVYADGVVVGKIDPTLACLSIGSVNSEKRFGPKIIEKGKKDNLFIDDFVIVSVGTGKNFKTQAKNLGSKGKLFWRNKIADITFTGCTESGNMMLEELYTHCKKETKCYRVQSKVPEHCTGYSMDNPKAIAPLKEFALGQYHKTRAYDFSKYFNEKMKIHNQDAKREVWSLDDKDENDKIL